MTYRETLIDAVVKHPAVSRYMGGHGPETPGIVALARLRRARRDVKRARRNMREEGQAFNRNAYDQGYIVQVPPMPGERLLREALAAGLAPELAEMVSQVLAIAPALTPRTPDDEPSAGIRRGYEAKLAHDGYAKYSLAQYTHLRRALSRQR